MASTLRAAVPDSQNGPYNLQTHGILDYLNSGHSYGPDGITVSPDSSLVIRDKTVQNL